MENPICESVRSMLPGFVDGDLSGDAHAYVQAHVSQCPACRREHDLLVASWDMLDSYVVPDVPGGFTEAVLRRANVASRRRRWVRWTAAAAALFAIGVGSVWAWRAAQRPSDAVIASTDDGHQTPDPKTPGKRPHVEVAALPSEDEELIRDLDVYENLELLRQLDMLSDFEVVENLSEES